MRPQPQLSHPSPIDRAADALRAAISAGGAVLLTGPTAPDGDSIGACLALAWALRQLGPARVDVAGIVSYRYAWMPGAETMLDDATIRPVYDLVVVLDGDRRRLEPQVAAAFDRAPLKGLVDHHRSTCTEGYDIVLVDPTAASACDLVHALIQAWGLHLDDQAAQLIYAGLVFDTGGFRHSNTTPATHRLAAELLEHDIDHATISTRILAERSPAGLRLLGAVVSDARFLAGGQIVIGAASYERGIGLGAGPGDIEGIVDHLVYVCGAELACFFIERSPGEIKLSLRSRRWVDVAALARSLALGGGGHARAAGAELHGPLEQVIAQVEPALLAAVAQGAPA